MSIKSEPFEHDVTKRVCVIRGPTVDNLDHAESLIKELLRERETTEKSIALNTSDDVGRVIGSGWVKINSLEQEKTNKMVSLKSTQKWLSEAKQKARSEASRQKFSNFEFFAYAQYLDRLI